MNDDPFAVVLLQADCQSQSKCHLFSLFGSRAFEQCGGESDIDTG